MSDALKNVEIGSFRFSGLNRQREAYDQGILFTYHLDLDGLLKVHAVERATGTEIHGVVENAIGRSTEEALAASRERIEGLWGEEAFPAERTREEPEEAPGSPDTPGEIHDTLKRATAALDTAPSEDQEEMIDLIEDIHSALKEGRTEDAAMAKRNLDEILFYLE